MCLDLKHVEFRLRRSACATANVAGGQHVGKSGAVTAVESSVVKHRAGNDLGQTAGRLASLACQLLILKNVPVTQSQVRPDYRSSEPSRSCRDFSRGLEPHSIPSGADEQHAPLGRASASMAPETSSRGQLRFLSLFFGLPDIRRCRANRRVWRGQSGEWTNSVAAQYAVPVDRGCRSQTPSDGPDELDCEPGASVGATRSGPSLDLFVNRPRATVKQLSRTRRQTSVGAL